MGRTGSTRTDPTLQASNTGRNSSCRDSLRNPGSNRCPLAGSDRSKGIACRQVGFRTKASVARILPEVQGRCSRPPGGPLPDHSHIGRPYSPTNRTGRSRPTEEARLLVFSGQGSYLANVDLPLSV